MDCPEPPIASELLKNNHFRANGDIAAFRSFAADSTALKSMLESRNNTFKSAIDLDSYLSGGASYSSASVLEVRRHERPQNRSKTMNKHANHEKT